MKTFASCVLVALLSGALASPAAVSRWESFKVKHGKQHAAHEEPDRMKTFLARDAEIEAHNAKYAAGEVSYSRKHNQYSDLTNEEFHRYALGFKPVVNASEIPVAQIETIPSLPEDFDWRDQGVMTPVGNQLYCGSCYAFACTGALEAYLKWKKNMNINLSEQDIIDCSYKKFMRGETNSGCEGGWPASVFAYYNIKDLVEENKYPYVSGLSETHNRCKISRPINKVVKGKLKVRHVTVANENDMRYILLSKGPVVVGLAADNEWKRLFDDLGEGVYDIKDSIDAFPNHAVVLVGYGSHQGKDYWLIKNSWGEDWGVNGYGKILRGKNMCGINTAGVFYVEE